MKKIYFLVVLVLLVPFFVVNNSLKTQAADLSAGFECGVTVSTKMLNPASGATVSGGLVPLLASSFPTDNLNKIEFHTKQRGLIGSGAVGSNLAYWSMNWDSLAYPDGIYDIFARAVYFNSFTSSYQTCDSPVNQIKVINGIADQETLIVDLSTKYWEGPTNIWVVFSARSYMHNTAGTNVEVTAGTAFEWSTSIGSIQPAHDKATFKSGAVAGEGNVYVKASYNNQTVKGLIKVKIYPNQQSTSYPSSTTTATTTADGAAITEGSAVTQRELDPKLAACLKQSVGESRYNELVTGSSKPTYEEIIKVWDCFEQTKYVIPTNWAPVKPEAVKTLPRDPKRVLIKKISNTKAKTTDGSEGTALVLSGVSVPNSDIFIYVFSEPLVLATKTDSDGNWSYTLENPLEAGKHEAYVTLNTGGDNYVASDPIVFDIARAESSDVNPQGASLVLADQKPYWQNNYIWYAAMAIGLALMFVLLFVKRRMNKKVTLEDVT